MTKALLWALGDLNILIGITSFMLPSWWHTTAPERYSCYADESPQLPSILYYLQELWNHCFLSPNYTQSGNEVSSVSCPGWLPMRLIDAWRRLNCQTLCSCAIFIIKTTFLSNISWSHIVTFIATTQKLCSAVNAAHLLSAHCLLFSMPTGTYTTCVQCVYTAQCHFMLILHPLLFMKQNGSTIWFFLCIQFIFRFLLSSRMS